MIRVSNRSSDWVQRSHIWECPYAFDLEKADFSGGMGGKVMRHL